MKYSEWFRIQKKELTLCEKEFCSWIDQVESIVVTLSGLDLLDCPDNLFMPWFEKNKTPGWVADKVLESISCI